MNQYRVWPESSRCFDLDFVHDNYIARSTLHILITNVVFEFRKAVEFEILIRLNAKRRINFNA